MASLSCARESLGIAVVGNQLYALGGSFHGESLRSVEKYDQTMNSWSPVEEMSLARYTMYYTILYYTILSLDYTILYYTILYFSILYYTILYYTLLD